MHFQKLQLRTRWEEPARFFGTLTCRGLVVVAAATEAKDNGKNLKTTPSWCATYHPLSSEEPGCTFYTTMRPRRSCLWAARGKLVCFQSKMTWLFAGNSSNHVNLLLAVGFCVFFLVLTTKRFAFCHSHFAFNVRSIFDLLNLLLHNVLLFSPLNPFLKV